MKQISLLALGAIALLLGQAAAAYANEPGMKLPLAIPLTEPAPEKAVPELPISDKPFVEKSAAEKPIADKPIADKPIAEPPPIEKETIAPLLIVPGGASEAPVSAAAGDAGEDLPPPPTVDANAPAAASPAPAAVAPAAPAPDPAASSLSPAAPSSSPTAAPAPAVPAPAVAPAAAPADAPTAHKPVELSFALPNADGTPAPPAAAAPAAAVSADASASASSTTNPGLDQLFAGNSDSLVAKAIGSAEGTRTPEGDRNPAYYGHTDPGNKAWNLGSFSYQHEAASPEEADQKQLDRLRNQAGVLQEKAAAYGLTLTLEETLNGIDLANQAPKAALDGSGYIDWLAQARQMGKQGSDAILWARVQSFLNPYTQRWDAPGLGNTYDNIAHDQERRMLAVSRAIAANPLPDRSQIASTLPAKETEAAGIDRLLAHSSVSAFQPQSPDLVAKVSPHHETPILQQLIDQLMHFDLSQIGSAKQRV